MKYGGVPTLKLKYIILHIVDKILAEKVKHICLNKK